MRGQAENQTGTSCSTKWLWFMASLLSTTIIRYCEIIQICSVLSYFILTEVHVSSHNDEDMYRLWYCYKRSRTALHQFVISNCALNETHLFTAWASFLSNLRFQLWWSKWIFSAFQWIFFVVFNVLTAHLPFFFHSSRKQRSKHQDPLIIGDAVGGECL